MFRDEETELPFRKRAQQLRMSIDKDPKVDRCLSIDARRPFDDTGSPRR
jgi:hypothetical protein